MRPSNATGDLVACSSCVAAAYTHGRSHGFKRKWSGTCTCRFCLQFFHFYFVPDPNHRPPPPLLQWLLSRYTSYPQSIFTPYFAHVLTDCCDDMEAASLLATSASDGPSAAKKKRKRGERKAKEAANKRKRRKTLSSGDLPDGNDDDDDDGGGSSDEDEDDTPELRWRRSAASRLVLSALRRCFQSDRSSFVNKARFDLLLPAVVAQLDCGSDFAASSVGGFASGADTEGADEVSSCRLHAEELVGPCLAQLASASGKDALWKAMANAVLMKTRSKRAGVRVAALVSLRQCFEVMGEEFLALLPECLPFLSELLEVSQNGQIYLRRV